MNLLAPKARLQVGIFFIGYAAINAALVVARAKHAQSPALFICLIGGLFSIVPAVLGISLIVSHRRMQRNSK